MGRQSTLKSRTPLYAVVRSGDSCAVLAVFSIFEEADDFMTATQQEYKERNIEGFSFNTQLVYYYESR